MLDRARCWSRVRERLFGWTSLNKLLALGNKAGLALMKDSVCFFYQKLGVVYILIATLNDIL